MSPSPFFWAMVATHIPYLLLVLCLMIGARRIRRHAESVAGSLEATVAAGGGLSKAAGPTRSHTNPGART